MADNTMVGVAVASVRDTFSLGVTALQWVVAGYVVAFAALLFTGGVLGDRYGRKRALVVGIGLFAAGAVVAASAWDWRGVVGGGGGGGGGGAPPGAGGPRLAPPPPPRPNTRAGGGRRAGAP